jgi:hypothetical protein
MCEDEAGGFHVLDQPGLHSKTLIPETIITTIIIQALFWALYIISFRTWSYLGREAKMMWFVKVVENYGGKHNYSTYKIWEL